MWSKTETEIEMRSELHHLFSSAFHGSSFIQDANPLEGSNAKHYAMQSEAEDPLDQFLQTKPPVPHKCKR